MPYMYKVKHSLSLQHGEETRARKLKDKQANLYGTFRKMALFPRYMSHLRERKSNWRDCSMVGKKEYSSFAGMGKRALGTGEPALPRCRRVRTRRNNPAKANKRQCEAAGQLNPVVGCIKIARV
jgi:hypothetical protein